MDDLVIHYLVNFGNIGLSKEAVSTESTAIMLSDNFKNCCYEAEVHMQILVWIGDYAATCS